eukprot:g982.t1
MEVLRHLNHVAENVSMLDFRPVYDFFRLLDDEKLLPDVNPHIKFYRKANVASLPSHWEMPEKSWLIDFMSSGLIDYLSVQKMQILDFANFVFLPLQKKQKDLRRNLQNFFFAGKVFYTRILTDCVVPIHDMMQHSEDNSMVYAEGTPNLHYEIFANRNIKKGEPLTTHYGSSSSYENKFSDFGFVPKPAVIHRYNEVYLIRMRAVLIGRTEIQKLCLNEKKTCSNSVKEVSLQVKRNELFSNCFPEMPLLHISFGSSSEKELENVFKEIFRNEDGEAVFGKSDLIRVIAIYAAQSKDEIKKLSSRNCNVSLTDDTSIIDYKVRKNVLVPRQRVVTALKQLVDNLLQDQHSAILPTNKKEIALQVLFYAKLQKHALNKEEKRKRLKLAFHRLQLLQRLREDRLNLMKKIQEILQ